MPLIIDDIAGNSEYIGYLYRYTVVIICVIFGSELEVLMSFKLLFANRLLLESCLSSSATDGHFLPDRMDSFEAIIKLIYELILNSNFKGVR